MIAGNRDPRSALRQSFTRQYPRRESDQDSLVTYIYTVITAQSGISSFRLALHHLIPMTPTAAGLGAAAIEALRAATLAAHHAAGLCRSAKFFDAARTARTGEALLRSATVLAGVQAPAAAPKAQRPSAAGAEAGVSEPCTASSGRKTKRGKKKKKDKDMDAPIGLVLTSAPVMDPFSASDLLDDSWADHVGDGVPPIVLADAAPLPAAAPPSSGGPRRVLAQRVSRERTPPPRAERDFDIGDFVKIRGLERHTELNGTCGSVIERAGDDQRFAVRLVSSECIRAKGSNLTLAPGCETSSLSSATKGAVQISSLNGNSCL